MYKMTSENSRNILDTLKTTNINTKKIEELYGQTGLDMVNDIIKNNAHIYSELEKNEGLKKVSVLVGSDVAKSLYINGIQNVISDEIIENLIVENDALFEENNYLKENMVIDSKAITAIEKIHNKQLVGYKNKHNKAPLKRIR